MSTTADLSKEKPSKDSEAGLHSNLVVGADRFVLKRILGRGGMGVVWQAFDKRLQELVALKFLPEQIAHDEAALADLRRETLRTRKLSHPNIIRIHDLNHFQDEPPFISMEYVDGPDLHDLRERQPGKVLRWDLLAPILRQLCVALEYAHGEKVIHRDLKPSNLLIDSNSQLKLSDFGLACVLNDSMNRLTGQANTPGTLCFMSPQQAEGERPSVGDDIYALGATLYDLLTSRPPFYSGDIGYQVRQTKPELMAQRLADLELVNEIPSEVSALVMACLAKDLGKRPSSAAAILQWLEGHEQRAAGAASGWAPEPGAVSEPAISAEKPPPPERAAAAFTTGPPHLESCPGASTEPIVPWRAGNQRPSQVAHCLGGGDAGFGGCAGWLDYLEVDAGKGNLQRGVESGSFRNGGDEPFVRRTKESTA